MARCCVDKPTGPTSHDVVDAIRRRFKLRKVGTAAARPQRHRPAHPRPGPGHAPSESSWRPDKVYEGTIRLGEATDTHDADGQITASLPVPR